MSSEKSPRKSQADLDRQVMVDIMKRLSALESRVDTALHEMREDIHVMREELHDIAVKITGKNGAAK